MLVLGIDWCIIQMCLHLSLVSTDILLTYWTYSNKRCFKVSCNRVPIDSKWNIFGKQMDQYFKTTSRGSKYVGLFIDRLSHFIALADCWYCFHVKSLQEIKTDKIQRSKEGVKKYIYFTHFSTNAPIWARLGTGVTWSIPFRLCKMSVK